MLEQRPWRVLDIEIQSLGIAEVVDDTGIRI